MIILDEKIVRKNIGFDLQEQDQRLAYQILMTKRGKELSKFVSKAVIMSEYLQKRSQTDYLLKRGNEILKEADGFFEGHSYPKEKKKRTARKIASEITDCVEITQKEPGAQTAQMMQKKENISPAQQGKVQDKMQTTAAEEIVHPANHSQKESVYESKHEPTPSVPDTMNDKTDEALEDDIFQQAMSFMRNL